MSSAILYVAIVAIWACVLIPRWLHRDSARGAGSAADTEVPGEVVHGDVVTDEYAAEADTALEAPVAADAPEEAPSPDAETLLPPPLAREESRRRMLAARRRLLGMLTILEMAAVALAVVGLAALWVLIPPSIMLAGYLLLLREAAHADAERAKREEEAERARARGRARARERAARHAAGTVATPAAAAPPAPAARYEDSAPGRDFAPGLAGKYTTSNEDVVDPAEESDEDFRDEYAVHTLRAVGD